MSGEEGIQVFVRVRPQNKKETQLNRSAIEVDPAKSAVIVTNKQGDGKNQQFVYDQVGGPECTQEHVFNKVGQPLCEAVLQGFNSTIFAYGQTGSGKTHTMLGGEDSSDVSLAVDSGLIPRVFHYLFSRIEDLKKEGKFDTVVCKASYLEIYNEVVSDLLSDSASNIVIRDDPRKGVVIEGDSQMAVSSAADTLQALSLGSQNRRVAATCMNKESSRSHCCFALHVSTTVKVDGVTTRKYAKFNLIDLAGSERQKATNATGDRLKEANNINRSLSALGNVIMALANSNGHVPYRDSKLTFMLKDSIGGNSKTCIIANCSPAQECVDETLSTLKFVRFAKLVRNMATVNQESAGGLEALKREITRLKAALAEKTAGGEQQGEGQGEGQEGAPAGDGSLAEEGGGAGGAGEVVPNQAQVVARVLEREAETRAALENAQAEAEVRVSALRNLASAYEKQLLAARMAVRLKQEYIAHLERHDKVSWPEREITLKLEIEELQKSLVANPNLIRQTIRIAELSAQVEEMEEEQEEDGSENTTDKIKVLEADAVQLSEVVRTLLNGKMAAEAAMDLLMTEAEDRNDSIEHLQALIGDHEFSLAARETELNHARDNLCDLEVRLTEQDNDYQALEVESKEHLAALEIQKLATSKVTEAKEQLQEEHDRLNEHAEQVVCEFEARVVDLEDAKAKSEAASASIIVDLQEAKAQGEAASAATITALEQSKAEGEAASAVAVADLQDAKAAGEAASAATIAALEQSKTDAEAAGAAREAAQAGTISELEDAKAQGEAREVAAAETIAELESAMAEQKAAGEARDAAGAAVVVEMRAAIARIEEAKAAGEKAAEAREKEQAGVVAGLQEAIASMLQEAKACEERHAGKVADLDATIATMSADAQATDARHVAEVMALNQASETAQLNHAEEVEMLNMASTAAAEAATDAAQRHGKEMVSQREEAATLALAAEASAKQEADSLRAQVEAGKEALQKTLEEEAAKAEGVETVHQTEMEEAKRMRQELQDNLASVQSELALAKEEAEAVTARLSLSEVALAETKEILQRTQAELATAQEAAEALAGEKATLARDLIALETEKAQADRTVDLLQHQTNELEGQKAAGEKLVAKLREDLSSLEALRDSLTEQRDSLQEQTNLLSEEKSELLIAAEKAAIERAALQAKMAAQLEAQQAEAKLQKESLEGEKSVLEKSLEALEAQVRKAEKARLKIDAALKEATLEREALREAGEQLRARNAELEDTAWKAGEARTEAEARRAASEKRTAEAETSEKAMQMSLETAKETASEAGVARMAAEEKFEEAAAALANQNKVADDLSVELNQSQKECHRKDNTIEAAEAKMDKAKEAALEAKDRHEAAAANLRAELESGAEREATISLAAQDDAQKAKEALAEAEERGARLETIRAEQAAQVATLAKARAFQEERAVAAEILLQDAQSLETQSMATIKEASAKLAEATAQVASLEKEVASLTESQKMHVEAMESLGKVSKERDAAKTAQQAQEEEGEKLSKKLAAQIVKTDTLKAQVGEMTDTFSAKMALLQEERDHALESAADLGKQKDAIQDSLDKSVSGEEQSRKLRQDQDQEHRALKASLEQAQKAASEAQESASKAESALRTLAEATGAHSNVKSEGGKSATENSRPRTVLGDVSQNVDGAPGSPRHAATPMKNRLRGSRSTLVGESAESPKMDR